MTSVIDIFMTLWEKAASNSDDEHKDYQDQALAALAYLVKFSRLNRFCKARVKLYQGWTAWLTNKPRQAFSAWKQSVAIARKRGLRLDEARSLFEIGGHLPVGDPARITYLRQAQEVFTQLKTPYYLSLVETALDRSIEQNLL